jgi:type VII secretion-associated serine protease mycosin
VTRGSTLLALALAVLVAGCGRQTVRQQEWPLTMFQADRVWALSRGAGVTVAVIDSGVDASHPDLSGQVLSGADLTAGGASDGTTDDDGHGTGMASIIAGTGRGRAGTGMMGLAPEAKILPVRVLSRRGQGVPSSEGIRYAVEHGARVVNVSLGARDTDSGYLSDLRSAVDEAMAHDAIVVASAGNEGTTGNPVEYPAGMRGVVAVAGVDSSSRPYSNTEHGPQVVLAAPATNLEHAGLAGGYTVGTGTSGAAAYVSATAALVAARFPGLSAGQIIDRLLRTASHPDGCADRSTYYGFGVVNPLAALTTNLVAGERANPLLTAPPPPANETGVRLLCRVRGLGTDRLVVAGAVGLSAIAILVALVVAVWAVGKPPTRRIVRT